jgi:hypothetical protein
MEINLILSSQRLTLLTPLLETPAGLGCDYLHRQSSSTKSPACSPRQGIWLGRKPLSCAKHSPTRPLQNRDGFQMKIRLSRSILLVVGNETNSFEYHDWVARWTLELFMSEETLLVATGAIVLKETTEQRVPRCLTIAPSRKSSE